MGTFERLMSADPRETLQFFFSELRDITEADKPEKMAVLYNAGVLAHHALTSTKTTDGLPTPATLADVFDRFVVVSMAHEDAELLELAGCQCLLLTGFFSDHLKRRHNLRWYCNLGAGFYESSARIYKNPAKRSMMKYMTNEFDYWRGNHLKLARELRARPYVLTLPPPDPSDLIKPS